MLADALLSKGADPVAASHNGYTPLHLAAMDGPLDLITRLVDLHNVPVSQQTKVSIASMFVASC